MSRRSESPIPLWQLLLIDAVSVGGILGLQALVGANKGDWLVWFEALAIVGVGVSTGYYWYRTVNREMVSDAGAAEAVEALRRENAANLRLLQDDVHSLGEALIKRLSQKPQSGAPEEPGVGVAAVAADLAEVKSTVYELQAQLDQLNDSLRHLRTDSEAEVSPDEVSPGASPAGLSRALSGAAAGSAISRLIANGGATKPVVEPTPEAPASSPGETGEEESEVEVEVEEFSGVDADEPELEAFSPSSDEVSREAALTGQEESDVDWLTAGLTDPENDEPEIPEKPPVAAPASQPDLLDLDEPQPTSQKARRPRKGETVLIAHMMIGIGNKPYLRGIGPGLSIEKGVPMEYVDVGVWQWICPQVGGEVALSVWKNDEFPAEGDLLELQPGETLEIYPRFEPQH